MPTQYCAAESLSFCKEIQEVSACSGFMISYDVCIFTNIPHKETTELSVSLIFKKHSEIKITTKRPFEKLFEFVTSGTHFLFERSYYDQIYWVGIGAWLGPILANLIMEYHKKVWLDEFTSCEVILYQHFVDDIICLFSFENNDE